MNNENGWKKFTENHANYPQNLGKIWKMPKWTEKLGEIPEILLLFSAKRGMIIIMGQNGTLLLICMYLHLKMRCALPLYTVISFIPEDINGNKEF